MGLMDSLFGKQSNKVSRPRLSWLPLNDTEQIDQIILNSKSKYQAIFKHSTRCGVSSGVLRQFERQENSDAIDFYFLDLLSHRAVSDEIASRLGVIHQSPQLIVLKNGSVSNHASHYDIMSIKLDDF